jgi:hypothetical protein
MASRKKQKTAEYLIPIAALAMIVAVTWYVRSHPKGQPADSSTAEFAAVASRIRWMERQFVDGPPSKIADAHFKELEVHHPHTHMGPPETMYWFMAKVEIDPKDAPAWAALTKPSDEPRWTRQSHPLKHPTAKWALTDAEFDGAAFYDPVPLLGSRRYRGYQGGRMVIPADGNAVYFWQHCYFWQHWR